MNRARFTRLLPLVIVALVVVIGIALAPPDAGRLDPKIAWDAPSSAHWLGAGEGGVDLLGVIAWGALKGGVLAIVVALAGFAIGTPLGALAALRRGIVERSVERACDFAQAFPSFLLALAVLASVRTPTRVHLGVVFALTAWAPFARLALAETRVLRSAAFVQAAYALGLETRAVVVRHVLPNLLGTVAVQLGSTAASVLVSEAALAFLGFGPRDGVSLGDVLGQGTAAMLRAPHVLAAGAFAIFAASAALLVAGTAASIPLERATKGLDPKVRE
ncbi:MAG TPA: ABC transporter permease [Polyangiaceae bacterium]